MIKITYAHMKSVVFVTWKKLCRVVGHPVMLLLPLITISLLVSSQCSRCFIYKKSIFLILLFIVIHFVMQFEVFRIVCSHISYIF